MLKPLGGLGKRHYRLISADVCPGALAQGCERGGNRLRDLRGRATEDCRCFLIKTSQAENLALQEQMRTQCFCPLAALARIADINARAAGVRMA